MILGRIFIPLCPGALLLLRILVTESESDSQLNLRGHFKDKCGDMDKCSNLRSQSC